jgi:hypothetical protein
MNLYTLSNFVLVNADTDRQVRSLVPGETLTTDLLGYRYNIIASTQSTGIDAVEFFVNNQFVRREAIAPYALCSDDGRGNFIPCTPSSFTYGTITLLANSIKNGIVVHSISIVFTIRKSARRLGQNTDSLIQKRHNERDNSGVLDSRPRRLGSGTGTADQLTPAVVIKRPPSSSSEGLELEGPKIAPAAALPKNHLLGSDRGSEEIVTNVDPGTTMTEDTSTV